MKPSRERSRRQESASLFGKVTDTARLPLGSGNWGTGTEQLPIVNAARPERRQRRRTKWRRWLLALSLLLLLAITVMRQGNGRLGAYAADMLRATLGPTATAQIESQYLGATDGAHQLLYRFGIEHASAPWASSSAAPPSQGHSLSGAASSSASPVAAQATPTVAPQLNAGVPPTDPQRSIVTPVSSSSPSPMPLPSIAPLITPSLPGEGVWTTSGLAPAAKNGMPLDAKTFWRPDPARPYAIVTFLQFDLRYTRLHMVAGIDQPGGPVGKHGSGTIPVADQQPGTLVAALNGGFKYADGAYGMMVDGTVYVPPVHGSGTIAITRDGSVIIGNWGVDPALSESNSNLVAWRQNGPLLLDHGSINTLTNNDSAWGITLNSVHTWRSGIGITKSGTLIYAAGNAITAKALAEAFRAAGAVTAIQTDINPLWVRAFTYGRDASGQLSIARLQPGMQGSGWEYLKGDSRDFFYLTRPSG